LLIYGFADRPSLPAASRRGGRNILMPILNILRFYLFGGCKIAIVMV